MSHRRGTHRLLAAVALLTALLLSRARAAEPPDFWEFPPDALAFAAVDPHIFGSGDDADPARALVPAGLRGLIDNAIPADSHGPLDLSAFLTPGILGSSAYRVCLLSLAVEPGREAAGRPQSRITALSAVIDIRAPRVEHDALIAGLHAAIDRAAPPRAATGTESAYSLPGGRRATRFERDGEPPWRTIEWTSSDTSLLVALGRGTLEKWLGTPPAEARPPAPARTEVAYHRSQAARARPRTVPILEFYLDLNALRRAAPDEFASGRLGRLASAWHLSNARGVMLHARIPRPPRPTKPGADEPAPAPPSGPPLIALELSYASRAEPPGTVRSIPISESAWPADADALPRPAAGSYIIVLRAAWPMWILTALDTYSALAPAPASTKPERWFRRHGPALERAAAHAGPWVVISGGPTPAGQPRPVAAAALLNPAAGKARIDADLRTIFASLGDEVRQTSGVWSLRLGPKEADPDGLLKQLGWGTSADGTLLEAAWDPAALAPRKPAR